LKVSSSHLSISFVWIKRFAVEKYLIELLRTLFSELISVILSLIFCLISGENSFRKKLVMAGISVKTRSLISNGFEFWVRNWSKS
jgi:hypothetical protein